MNFDDLPDKQQKFIDLYLDSGDRDEAYREAGYSIEGRGWKMNARKLFIKLQPIIEERLETRIGEGAMLALKVVKDLMMSAKSEAVRLKAAQDYLARGGRDRVRESRVIITDESQMSDKELDDEITALQTKLSGGKIIVRADDKLH